MRSLVVFALALVACATHPLPAGTDRSPPICAFGTAVWEHAVPLEVPGGTYIYAHANTNGSYPPSAKGAALHLHNEPVSGHRGEPLDAVLELSLERDGYTLWAETSARDEPVLSTEAGFPVGDFGQVMPGAAVKIVGGQPGEAAVEPASWATEDFVPVSLPATRLKCEDLVLHLHERGPEVAEKELAQLKLGPVLREALISPGAAVELHASPGGPVRGNIRADPQGHFVRVLEEKDGWSRVVAAHWVGVYWFGWVKTDQLQVAPEEKPEPAAAPPGGSPPAFLQKGQRCDSNLDLFVEKSGVRQPIGQLAKNTAFTLMGGDGEFAVLDVHGLWFTLEDGVRLEVPEKARACPPR
ncbi:MAG: hypothetical protein QM723_24270 [Myxococcaceae bacterium]